MRHSACQRCFMCLACILWRPVSYLTLLGLLAGCASFYKVPENSPQAILKTSVDFGDTYVGIVRVHAFDNDKCARSSHGSRLAYFSKLGERTRKFGADTELDSSPGPAVRVPIIAGRELVFTVAFELGTPGITTYFTCRITRAFSPEPGRTYHAAYSLGSRKCLLALTEVSNSGEEVVVERVRQVQPTCFATMDG